jgi:putative hydrolase of the HAD superfamily
MQNPRLPEAILFDLDDTIIAHSAGANGLWHELCHRYAALLEGIDADILLEAVHKARAWYWGDLDRHRGGRLNLLQARREVVALAFEALAIDNPEISEQLADSFSVEREKRVELFPGAVDTLDRLKVSGIKLGMVTNGASEIQRGKIERFNIGPYFDCISVEGEFGEGKPDVSIFLHTLERLGTAPDRAWMVGDDLHRDIEGAQKAGIYTVWVDWQDEGLPEGTAAIPDRIVTRISELVCQL